MHACMHAWKHGCMYVPMYACTYVHSVSYMVSRKYLKASEALWVVELRRAWELRSSGFWGLGFGICDLGQDLGLTV